jgi:hypothetical protein
MPNAAEYREQAEALFRRARETADDTEALAYTLRAIELEVMAEQLERGQVQQDGTQPPAAPPQQPAQQQPAQQQQQAQPSKKDD